MKAVRVRLVPLPTAPPSNSSAPCEEQEALPNASPKQLPRRSSCESCSLERFRQHRAENTSPPLCLDTRGLSARFAPFRNKEVGTDGGLGAEDTGGGRRRTDDGRPEEEPETAAASAQGRGVRGTRGTGAGDADGAVRKKGRLEECLWCKEGGATHCCEGWRMPTTSTWESGGRRRVRRRLVADLPGRPRVAFAREGEDKEERRGKKKEKRKGKKG